MPRKTEIQTEETAVASPLRRSSRTGGAGTPSSVKTRRTSLLSQDNEKKDIEEERIESRPDTRTRRAVSVTKDERQQKLEPVKPRTRRSSVASELPSAEEKRQPITRSRRSSATEEPLEAVKASKETSRKTIRTRRSSAQEEKIEESPGSKTTQLRVFAIETESKGNTTEGKPSVEYAEVIEEPPKRASRTRRSSTDKTEEEPEPKISKPSTPKKTKRRLSITDNVVPLEPITEQDTEVDKRSSISSIPGQSQDVKPTQIKKTDIKKADLDLSVIKETSFTEETDTSPKKEKSFLNKTVGEDIPVVAKVSPKETAKLKLTPIKKKDPRKVTPELRVICEEINKSVVTPKSFLEIEENRLGLRRVSPRLNQKSITPQKLSFTDQEDSITEVNATETLAIEENQSVEFAVEEDTVFVDTPTSTTEGHKIGTGTTISSGSDGSFCLHLSSSLMKTSSQDSQDDALTLNTSNISSGSDKENIEIVKTMDRGKLKQLNETNTIAVLAESVNITQKNTIFTVGRVSNIFRPKNVECSFIEPMEVDKTIFDTNTSVANLNTGENITEDVEIHSSSLENKDTEFSIPKKTFTNNKHSTKFDEDQGTVGSIPTTKGKTTDSKSFQETTTAKIGADVVEETKKPTENDEVMQESINSDASIKDLKDKALDFTKSDDDNNEFLSAISRTSDPDSSPVGTETEKKKQKISDFSPKVVTAIKQCSSMMQGSTEENSRVIDIEKDTVVENKETCTPSKSHPISEINEEFAESAENSQNETANTSLTKLSEISEECELNLMDDDGTIMQPNKADASQDFEFNVPSDEENEENPSTNEDINSQKPDFESENAIGKSKKTIDESVCKDLKRMIIETKSTDIDTKDNAIFVESVVTSTDKDKESEVLTANLRETSTKVTGIKNVEDEAESGKNDQEFKQGVKIKEAFVSYQKIDDATICGKDVSEVTIESNKGKFHSENIHEEKTRLESNDSLGKVLLGSSKSKVAEEKKQISKKHKRSQEPPDSTTKEVESEEISSESVAGKLGNKTEVSLYQENDQRSEANKIRKNIEIVRIEDEPIESEKMETTQDKEHNVLNEKEQKSNKKESASLQKHPNEINKISTKEKTKQDNMSSDLETGEISSEITSGADDVDEIMKEIKQSKEARPESKKLDENDDVNEPSSVAKSNEPRTVEYTVSKKQSELTSLRDADISSHGTDEHNTEVEKVRSEINLTKQDAVFTVITSGDANELTIEPEETTDDSINIFEINEENTSLLKEDFVTKLNEKKSKSMNINIPASENTCTISEFEMDVRNTEIKEPNSPSNQTTEEIIEIDCKIVEITSGEENKLPIEKERKNATQYKEHFYVNDEHDLQVVEVQGKSKVKNKSKRLTLSSVIVDYQVQEMSTLSTANNNGNETDEKTGEPKLTTANSEESLEVNPSSPEEYLFTEFNEGELKSVENKITDIDIVSSDVCSNSAIETRDQKIEMKELKSESEEIEVGYETVEIMSESDEVELQEQKTVKKRKQHNLPNDGMNDQSDDQELEVTTILKVTVDEIDEKSTTTKEKNADSSNSIGKSKHKPKKGSLDRHNKEASNRMDNNNKSEKKSHLISAAHVDTPSKTFDERNTELRDSNNTLEDIVVVAECIEITSDDELHQNESSVQKVREQTEKDSRIETPVDQSYETIEVDENVKEDEIGQEQITKKKETKRKKPSHEDSKSFTHSQEVASQKKRVKLYKSSNDDERVGRQFKNNKKPAKMYNTEENDDEVSTSSVNDVETKVECEKIDKLTKIMFISSEDTDTSSPFKETKKAVRHVENFKLDEYLNEKMKKIGEEEDRICEEESEKGNCNNFLDDMAEEVEEDTPSEDSNEIIDEGESINTTESEWSDHEVDTDSFICDEESEELLSGEEYDLDNATKNTINRKRIINIDNCEDDVIKINKKKAERPLRRKKSTIVAMQTSDNENDSEEQSLEKSSIEDNDISNHGSQEEITEDNVFEETVSDSDENQSEDSASVENMSKKSSQESLDKSECEVVKVTQEKLTPQSNLRRAKITIHENIKVSDIQDPVLSNRINHLVDSFSKNLSKGDVSVNLSMEYQGKSSERSTSKEVTTDNKNRKKKKYQLSSSENLTKEMIRKDCEKSGGSPIKKMRLSGSLNNSEFSNSSTDKRSLLRSRMSMSTGDINLKKKGKRMKKAQRNTTKDLIRRVQKKPIRKSLSAEDLRAETFSIMNQLLNDVRNRPRRAVKPSTTKPDSNNSWVVDDVNEIKPSTSLVTNKDIEEFKAKKIHKKDFKSQVLNDPSRVKRIDTKALLKKKGGLM